MGRRGGGSLSPRPIVRVGGGGSLLVPNGFRSPSTLNGDTSCERLGRGGGIDAGGGSSRKTLAPRRTGSGGGDVYWLRFGADEETKVGVGSTRPADALGRGGGLGGGAVAGREDRDTGVGLGLESGRGGIDGLRSAFTLSGTGTGRSSGDAD